MPSVGVIDLACEVLEYFNRANAMEITKTHLEISDILRGDFNRKFQNETSSFSLLIMNLL